jgi:hypothetical protein
MIKRPGVEAAALVLAMWIMALIMIAIAWQLTR